MNDKKILFTVFCAAVCVSVCFTDCTSTYGLSKSDAELIDANSRNIGRIEGTIDALGDTINDSHERLEIVARASSRIRDASERLAYLFDEYEREVQRILTEIDELRKREQTFKEDKMDGVAGSGNRTDNPCPTGSE